MLRRFQYLRATDRDRQQVPRGLGAGPSDWPAKSSGEGFRVIEEALNGRTTVRDDPVEEYKNGKDYLRPCLESHAPLELVIIALGINELKARFFASASDAADGAGVLVNIVQQSGAGLDGGPPAVCIAPPPVGFLTELALMFTGAEEKSKGFSRQYHRVAEKYGCVLLDAGEVVRERPRRHTPRGRGASQAGRGRRRVGQEDPERITDRGNTRRTSTVGFCYNPFPEASLRGAAKECLVSNSSPGCRVFSDR